MKNIFLRIWQLLRIAYFYVAGVTNIVYGELKSYVITLFVITIIMIVLIIVVLMIGYEPLIYITSFALALFVMSVYVVSNFIVTAVYNLTGRITIKEVTCEMKRLLNPLVTVALSFAFISCWAVISGTSDFSLKDFGIYMAVTLFFIIFSLLFRQRSYIFHFGLATVVIIMLVVNYLLPVQTQSLVDWVDRKSYELANSINKHNEEGQFVLLPKGAPVYDENMKGLGNTKDTMKVMIIDVRKPKGGGEKLYKVMSPNPDGFFINGNIFYVPIRFTQKIVPAPMTQNNQQVIPAVNYDVKSDFNSDGNTEIVRIEPGGTKGSRLDFVDGEYFEVLELVGETSLTDYKTYGNKVSNMTDIILGKTYKVHIDPKVKSGPLFFFSKTGCIIKIRKYS